jgi:peptide/nickel transport system permease protein
MVTAYVQGGFDDVLMRVVDVLLSIPPLILALLVVNSLGYSATLLVCTLAFFYTPRVARVVRAATLGVVMEDFVAAAKARGESSWSIAARELFPNVVGVVFVEFAVRTAYAVTFIGSMGFLGFGPPAPAPEWGRMVNESREFIATAPWVTVAPAVAIASLVVALNVFTDGVAQGLTKVVQWEHR